MQSASKALTVLAVIASPSSSAVASVAGAIDRLHALTTVLAGVGFALIDVCAECQ